MSLASVVVMIGLPRAPGKRLVIPTPLSVRWADRPMS
jgi:hypothetical protein